MNHFLLLIERLSGLEWCGSLGFLDGQSMNFGQLYVRLLSFLETCLVLVVWNEGCLDHGKGLLGTFIGGRIVRCYIWAFVSWLGLASLDML